MEKKSGILFREAVGNMSACKEVNINNNNNPLTDPEIQSTMCTVLFQSYIVLTLYMSVIITLTGFSLPNDA